MKGEGMFRFFVAVFFILELSACTRLQEAWMPVEDKVNQAYPQSAELKISAENLNAILASDSEAKKDMKERYASMMRLRAYTCLDNRSVGRFASVESVKALSLSTECFAEQDKKILEYLGLSQIGIQLSKPPLRPLAPLGKPKLIPLAGIPETFSGDAASGAGVAILHSVTGEHTAIEIPGGKKISSMAPVPDNYYQPMISPNGRVLAVGAFNRSLTFFDVESGNKIWETTACNQLLAWLPEMSAALATESKTGNLVLMDMKQGNIQQHPSGMKNQTWAVPVSVSPSRILIGNQRDFVLAEHERTPNGITSSDVDTYHLSQGSGVSSTSPSLMLDGHALFFITGRDYLLYDLGSKKETLLQTENFMGNSYAKLGENTVLVDSNESNGIGTKPWILNVEDQTLSPVDENESGKGIIYRLSGRTGFMRRGYAQVWFGDEIHAGTPQSLESFISARTVERQLALLALKTRADEMAGGMNGQYPSYIAPAPAPAAPPLAPLTGMHVFPSDAQVYAIGVYEGERLVSNEVPNHPTKEIKVTVRSDGHPVVLALNSYEPVQWNINSQGAKIASVLLSGYYPSRVIGAGNAHVLRIGSEVAYKPGSADYYQLTRAIARYIATPIRSFQGTYKGNEFTVQP